MTKQTVLIAIAASLIGFIGGFMLANSLNRSELTSRVASSEQMPANTQAPDGSPASTTLTPEELKARVEMADRNPNETVSIIRSWLNDSAAA